MSSPPSFKSLAAAACFAALAGCQTSPRWTTGVKYMEVNGARLPYLEQGSGPAVVLVHGAVSDYRTWNRHVEALANNQYRAISYTQPAARINERLGAQSAPVVAPESTICARRS